MLCSVRNPVSIDGHLSSFGYGSHMGRCLSELDFGIPTTEELLLKGSKDTISQWTCYDERRDSGSSLDIFQYCRLQLNGQLGFFLFPLSALSIRPLLMDVSKVIQWWLCLPLMFFISKINTIVSKWINKGWNLANTPCFHMNPFNLAGLVQNVSV